MTFRPRPEASSETLRALDARVQAFAHRRPGIIRRTTAVAGDGEWLVVTLWQDVASADAAATAARDDEACGALAELAGPAGTTVRRYEDLGG